MTVEEILKESGNKDFFETHFLNSFCRTVRQSIEFKFPNIKNLEVSFDEEGICHIIFEETEYTRKEVEDYIEEIKKLSPKK